jgi:DNA-binding transcriptional regulator/RsmH inhibitor MraZ
MKAGLLSQDFADRMDDEMDALQTFLGNCDFTAVDPQARLPLQGYLREWAGVEEGQQVVVIGKGDRLEVWNKERFREASLKITATRLKEISARRKTEGGVVPATVASEAQEA